MKSVVKSYTSPRRELPSAGGSRSAPSFLAAGGAFLASCNGAPWLHDLAIVSVAAALALVCRDWRRRRAGAAAEAKPAPRTNGLGADLDANRGARALAFEDRIDAAIAGAGRLSRHAGLISLWWVPGVDVDATQDMDPLRALLARELGAGAVLHFADDDRAWVLVDNLRSYEELQEVEERLVQALVRQTETPLRTVASGCAIAPTHGVEARELIEFADAHQEHQIRIHPFRTYAKARATHGANPARAGSDRMAI